LSKAEERKAGPRATSFGFNTKKEELTFSINRETKTSAELGIK